MTPLAPPGLELLHVEGVQALPSLHFRALLWRALTKGHISTTLFFASAFQLVPRFRRSARPTVPLPHSPGARKSSYAEALRRANQRVACHYLPLPTNTRAVNLSSAQSHRPLSAKYASKAVLRPRCRCVLHRLPLSCCFVPSVMLLPPT